jgi:purine-binding chemotaxis protein CheW
LLILTDHKGETFGSWTYRRPVDFGTSGLGKALSWNDSEHAEPGKKEDKKAMAATECVELEDQLVVFDVGQEAFGVDISAVQEIIRMKEVTKVPGAPSFVEGIINLRGRIIPVIDLRRRLGLPLNETDLSGRIVVVEIDSLVIGMVVDAVSEVLHISADCVEPPSDVIAGIDSDYIRGIAKVDDRLIVLLQLEKLLTGQRMGTVQGGEDF